MAAQAVVAGTASQHVVARATDQVQVPAAAGGRPEGSERRRRIRAGIAVRVQKGRKLDGAGRGVSFARIVALRRAPAARVHRAFRVGLPIAVQVRRAEGRAGGGRGRRRLGLLGATPGLGLGGRRDRLAVLGAILGDLGLRLRLRLRRAQRQVHELGQAERGQIGRQVVAPGLGAGRTHGPARRDGHRRRDRGQGLLRPVPVPGRVVPIRFGVTADPQAHEVLQAERHQIGGKRLARLRVGGRDHRLERRRTVWDLSQGIHLGYRL